MSEAEYITPTTWEECARHVEAGGIVEVKVGEWHAQHSPPSAYRSLIGSFMADGSPVDIILNDLAHVHAGRDSLPRRLVPIEPVGGYEATIVELDEASDWMGPAMTTTIDVPDGYEVVVLPTGTVDHCAKEWGGYVGQMGGVGMACREAVARRQSATERVPWWEAVGRGLAGSKIEILEVGMDAEGPWVEVDLSRHPHRMHSWVDPSGMVEVEL